MSFCGLFLLLVSFISSGLVVPFFTQLMGNTSNIINAGLAGAGSMNLTDPTIALTPVASTTFGYTAMTVNMSNLQSILDSINTNITVNLPALYPLTEE